MLMDLHHAVMITSRDSHILGGDIIVKATLALHLLLLCVCVFPLLNFSCIACNFHFRGSSWGRGERSDLWGGGGGGGEIRPWGGGGGGGRSDLWGGERSDLWGGGGGCMKH